MKRVLMVSLLMLFTPLAQAQVVDQKIPNEPIELALWKADVQIVLQEGAQPHLIARAVRAGAVDEELEGPTVRIVKKGAAWKVVRAAESQDVRLQVELVADLAQQVKLSGSEIGVSIQGPPVDFEAMAAQRESGSAADMPAPVWSDLTLALAESQVDVFGVSGALLQGRNTYFHVRQSSNELRVELEGGEAEIEQHRGELGLYGGGGFTVRDAIGMIEVDISEGAFELNAADGRLEGQIAGASSRIFEWNGLITLETRGGDLNLANFSSDPQEISLIAQGTEVTIDAVPRAKLDVKQTGGVLRIRDMEGKNKIEASTKAEVELERLRGSWTLLLQDSQGRVEETDRLTLESFNSELEAEELQDLELNAHDSKIEASGVWRLGKGTLIRSTAQIAMNGGGRGEVDAQDGSRATMNLTQPCFVLERVERSADNPMATVKSDDEDGNLDVFGCTEGSRSGEQSSDEDPTFLTVAYSGESEIEVRGF